MDAARNFRESIKEKTKSFANVKSQNENGMN